MLPKVVFIVALIVLSAMIADGFDRLEAPPQLYQIRRNTAIFIDEVQDFREIEVLLMGMVVTDSYRQITLSGDRRQQLQAMGTEDLRGLFPFVPRSLRNSSVFLDQNFRQRKELQILSAGIRSILQEDVEPTIDKESRPRHALLLGCDEHAIEVESLQKLKAHGIVAMAPIQESLLS